MIFKPNALSRPRRSPQRLPNGFQVRPLVVQNVHPSPKNDLWRNDELLSFGSKSNKLSGDSSTITTNTKQLVLCGCGLSSACITPQAHSGYSHITNSDRGKVAQILMNRCMIHGWIRLMEISIAKFTLWPCCRKEMLSPPLVRTKSTNGKHQPFDRIDEGTGTHTTITNGKQRVLGNNVPTRC